MTEATIEADEAVASSDFVQIMGTPLKNLLVRVTSPRLILRSGYGDDCLAILMLYWHCLTTMMPSLALCDKYDAFIGIVWRQ